MSDVGNGVEREPTVVVIDDDPSIRRALARLLGSYDLIVETYPSAEDFLAATHSRDIACLVVDVQMTGMSGLDLLERLSATGHILPSVVITAFDDPATRERVRERGATLLRKPFESDAILAAVGGMLGRDLDPAGF